MKRFGAALNYTQGAKQKLLKWVLACGAFGLAIPFALLLGWKLTGSFGELQLILWPSSILLMGLDGPSPRSNLDILETYAALIGENVVLIHAHWVACLRSLLLGSSTPEAWVLSGKIRPLSMKPQQVAAT